MSRSAAAALARRLATTLGAAAASSGLPSASASAPAVARATAASAVRAPLLLSTAASSSSSSSSWTVVSSARALSSASSASSASIPSLGTLTSSSAGADAAAAAAPRRSISSSAAPRASDDDDDDDVGGGSGPSGRDYYESIIYPSSSAAVGQRAPGFTAPAVIGGEVRPLSLSDYRGRYVALLWYPKDFTYVCPTELIAFSDRAKEFEELNCQVIAASTDSEECHLAWIKTPRHRGGLGFMQIPVVADITKEIAARYGVLLESAGIALRGLFIINPEGIIQHITINDLPIGRSVNEALRTLQAIRFHAEHGEVCPAGWKPGDRTMKADAEKALDYFGNVYKESPEGEDMAPSLKSIKSRREWEALLKGGKPFVLDLFAPWCGKCRMISPLLEELQSKHPGIVFAKLDTTAEPVEPIAAELGVKALPAFHFYGADGKPALQPVTGYKRRPLEEAVTQLAQMASSS